MLEAIRGIGRTVRNTSDKDFVLNLVEYDSIDIEDNKGNRLNLLLLNFNLKDQVIEFEPRVLDYNRLEEYLWIGNAKGSLPQDRLTTNTLKYLLSDSIINLYKGLEDCELKLILEDVVRTFFLTLDFKGRDIYVLDLRKIKFVRDEPDFTLPQMTREYTLLKEYTKELESLYEKKFLDVVKKYLGIDKKDIALFSIAFDREFPSSLPDYKRYIERKIIEENFENGFDGICHTCGKKDFVTYNTARFPVKFYITKLITFSSQLEGGKVGRGFSKNFSLCRDCYKDIIVGIKYIQSNLYSELAGNDLWIIPGLFFNPLGETLTNDWAKLSKIFTTSTFTLKDSLNFEEKTEKELENYRKFEELIDYSFVDLLFYEKNKEAFKIKELIKDVPLRRIKAINSAIKDVEKLGTEILGEDRGWFLGLSNIYFLIPIRRGKNAEYKKILDIYEDIFLANKLEKEVLIDSFVELFGIYRFEKFSQYNIKPQGNAELSTIFAILRTNLLLKLFERLGMITGGESMTELLKGILDRDIENYILKMGYKEEESALFLLGYLIGEIGNEQVKGSDFNAKKPILNKINFNGISAKSLINLSNEVFEKLDQYRIRGFNEKIFFVMKELMDKHTKDWSLTDNENVYYILSGYAYNTYRKIKNIRNKEEEGNE